jgi:hypothetical protein
LTRVKRSPWQRIFEVLVESLFTGPCGPFLAFGFANDLWAQKKVEQRADDYWPPTGRLILSHKARVKKIYLPFSKSPQKLPD